MREVFGAGEKPQKGSALLSSMVANCPAQHGVTRFQCIEYGTLCNRPLDVESYLSIHVGQRAQVGRYFNSYQVAIPPGQQLF